MNKGSCLSSQFSLLQILGKTKWNEGARSILVLYFLQHAAYFCSTWMTSLTSGFEKIRGVSHSRQVFLWEDGNNQYEKRAQVYYCAHNWKSCFALFMNLLYNLNVLLQQWCIYWHIPNYILIYYYDICIKQIQANSDLYLR